MTDLDRMNCLIKKLFVTDHSVDRNADFGCFFAVNLVEMLDVRSSTPALSTQFTTKNHLKLDVLLNQTTRPDLLQLFGDNQ